MTKILDKLKTMGNEGIALPVNRLIVLSEIIFGLAMSMLVFALEIPELDSSESEFIAVLKDDFEVFLIFLITFILLVIYWLGHVRRFSYIIKTNRTHLFIELLGLFFILILPFTNGLISVHPDYRIIVLVYGINLILIGVFAYWGWSYASHNKQLIKEDVSKTVIKEIKGELILEPIVVSLSLLIGMIKPSLFNLCMILIPIIHMLYVKIMSSKKAML